MDWDYESSYHGSSNNTDSEDEFYSSDSHTARPYEEYVDESDNSVSHVGDSQQDAQNDFEVDPEKASGAEFVAYVFETRFSTVEEADSFFTLYATETGFNPRRSSMKKDKKTFRVITREWVCASAGTKREFPYEVKRRPSRLDERSNCKARFRIIRCRVTGQYKATHFITEHNHPLKITPDQRRYLKFNRFLSASRQDIMRRMSDAGIKTCNTIDFLREAGGANGNGVFIPRDGYNFLNKEKMSRVRGGDANALFNLIDGMKLKDPSVVLEWTLDENSQLNKIFWCDGRSIIDYKLFGDVLIFDSTYKVNKYRFPFVMFSGVNSHLQTVVFGCGFLKNETIESYRWLLKKLLQANGNNPPKSVLTDQDPAMKKAIEEEFKGVPHRLCCWHVSRNAESNIKTENFSKEFSFLMNRVCTIDQFEDRWKQLMIDFPDAAKTNWVKDIYGKREHWAEAYFRGKFFAMMRSTQRAESLNAHLKRRVNSRITLTDFYRLYTHHFMDTIRARFEILQIDSERQAQIPSKNGLSPLEKLLDHVRRTCTIAVFNQIKKESALIAKMHVVVREIADAQCHTILYSDSSAHFWPYKRYTAVIDLANSSFKCTCRMLESDGIPCRHIMEGLMGLEQTTFPLGSIHPRWSTTIGHQIRIDFPYKDNKDSAAQAAGKVAELLITNSNNPEFYEQHKEKIDELTTSLLKAPAQDKTKLPPRPPKHPSGVKDPDKIIPKGGAKDSKKKACTDCGNTGHNKTTCEIRKAREAREAAALQNSQAEASNVQSADECASNYDFRASQNHPSQDTSRTDRLSFVSLLRQQNQPAQPQAHAQAQAHAQFLQQYNNVHYYPQFQPIPMNPTYFPFGYPAQPSNGPSNASTSNAQFR